MCIHVFLHSDTLFIVIIRMSECHLVVQLIISIELPSCLKVSISYTNKIKYIIKYLKTQTLTYLIGNNLLNSYNYHSISTPLSLIILICY